MNRALQTNEQNKKLDDSIDSFMSLLSPFFLMRPAHKALELLVRKYRVHEYNVEALIACVLPYHSTKTFVRAVQLLNLKKHPRWAFLSAVQKSGYERPTARTQHGALHAVDARRIIRLHASHTVCQRSPPMDGSSCFVSVTNCVSCGTAGPHSPWKLSCSNAQLTTRF